MRIFRQQRPWYADGLAFECVRCGRCCAGPAEGYVWVKPADIQAIAALLKLSAEQVNRRYIRQVGRRHSLLESPPSKDCIFLRYDADGKSECLIYPVRPAQCRTWPFWPKNLDSPDAWARGQLRCPGINRGPVHHLEEVQCKRDQTAP